MTSTMGANLAPSGPARRHGAGSPRSKAVTLSLGALGLTLILAACSGAATPIPATPGPATPAPATPAPAATAAPATAAPATPADMGAVTITAATGGPKGSYLADGAGMALYLFTKDVPNTSNCYDKCETAWPPLLAKDAASITLAAGVTGTVGITDRKDGTKQVTLNGWPLYYFAADQKAGDITGQGVNDVWYLLDASGQSTAPVGGVVLSVATGGPKGSYLADGKGMALYLFTKDTGTTSACYDGCATAWPPLLATDATAVKAGEGVKGAIGVTDRKDGTRQVTYNGKPLYYFAADLKAGDITGQGVNDVWFLLEP